MPITPGLQINIEKAPVDIADRITTGVAISYSLEDPENFEQKQASVSLGLTLPATPNNDRIFNTFHNPAVIDTGVDAEGGLGTFTAPMACEMSYNGVTIFKGKSILQEATAGRMPGTYTINCYGQNGDWVIDMQDMTLADAVNPTNYVFDVPGVELTWSDFNSGEYKDIVYIPVRYRQPFNNPPGYPLLNGGLGSTTDDSVNIYHMRPAISIYWMIVRAFRKLGFSLNQDPTNDFLTSTMFQNLVLLWTWGNFYNISGDMINAIGFKAAGCRQDVLQLVLVTTGTPLIYSGHVDASDNTQWSPYDGNNLGGGGATSGIVSFFTQPSAGGSLGPTVYRNFYISNVIPPHGRDTFSNYSFGGGAMNYTFNPPAALTGTIPSTVSLEFTLNLICQITATSGNHTQLFLVITQYLSGGGSVIRTNVPINGNISSDNRIPELFLTGGGTMGSLLTPTGIVFSVSGVNVGDAISVQLAFDTNGTHDAIQILSQAWVNENPSGTAHYVLQESTIELTGINIDLGGSFNLLWYDKLRSYKFLDMFRGLVGMFNLSVQTDPINRVVTIAPTHSGYFNDGNQYQGYYKDDRIDWTHKLDLSKEATVQNYADTNRQLEFQFKPDGNNGAENIWTGRNKGVYLNNRNNWATMNTLDRNGVYGIIPGSARYMFPIRFMKGVKSMTNRFFSATMHCMMPQWKSIAGITPQMITMFPENISDSSQGAIDEAFEPKIAYYKGLLPSGVQGGWRWIGDPAAPYDEATSTSFGYPFASAVNYGGGDSEPVLTYCDQNIGGVLRQGLVSKFYGLRLNTMRQGKLYKAWMRLNLTDITDWEHRNVIIIEGQRYYLIAIDNYNPSKDDSVLCTFWKSGNTFTTDSAVLFPSAGSVLTNPRTQAQYDLKYAPMLVYNTDLPQV